jgi:hypothetical protein
MKRLIIALAALTIVPRKKKTIPKRTETALL